MLCCCQGLETQGRWQGQEVKLQGQGQGQGLDVQASKDEDKDEDLSFKNKDKDLGGINTHIYISCRHRARSHVISCSLYCRCHVTDKQRSALDIKDIRDSYGLLAVTRMHVVLNRASNHRGLY